MHMKNDSRTQISSFLIFLGEKVRGLEVRAAVKGTRKNAINVINKGIRR